MSLIEEALRRAQRGLQPERRETPIRVQIPDPAPVIVEPPPAAGAPVAEASDEASRPMVNWAVIGLIGGAAVGAIVWIAWGYWAPPAVSQPVAAQSTQAVRAPAIAEPAIRALSRRALPPVLALNGVVEGTGEPLAIVNGSMLRVGDTIEGATLIEIKTDTVTLRWRDQELILRTTP